MLNFLLVDDDHYTSRVTWRGHLALNNIKSKFQDPQFLERARTCPFKQLFEAPALRFSGVIIHQLLLRKIKSGSRNEIHFELVGDLWNLELVSTRWSLDWILEHILKKRCLTTQGLFLHKLVSNHYWILLNDHLIF